MITKAFQARVICDDETREKLWKLTETFNERVLFILKKMLDMRAGRVGPELKGVFDAIGGSQNAFAKMEAIGKEKWSTTKLTSSDAECFRKIRDQLEHAIRGIGGWIDEFPMEWRDHFRKDSSLLHWRRNGVVFTDFSDEELAKIEKQKQPPRDQKKTQRTQAGIRVEITEKEESRARSPRL